MGRDKAPLEKVEVESNVRAYAKEHGLIFDEHYLPKIRWSEEHGGRCFCKWDSDRRCPCSHVQEDLIRYNGTCLCSVLKTPKCYARVLKRRYRPLPIRLSCNVVMKSGIISESIPKKNNGEKKKKAELLWKNLTKK